MENFSGSVVEPRSPVPPLPNIPSEMPPKNKTWIIILVAVEVIVVLGFLIVLLITIFNEPEDIIAIDDVVDDSSSSGGPKGVSLSQEEISILSEVSVGGIAVDECRNYGTVYNKYADIDIFPFELCKESTTVRVVSRNVSIDKYKDIEFYQFGLGDENYIYTITTYDNLKMFYGVSYSAASTFEVKRLVTINE